MDNVHHVVRRRGCEEAHHLELDSGVAGAGASLGGRVFQHPWPSLLENLRMKYVCTD